MSRKKMKREQLEMARIVEVEEAVVRRKRSGSDGEANGELGKLEGDGKGILPFRLQGVADGSDATGRAGLCIVGETMRGFRLDEIVQRHLDIKQRQKGFTEMDFVEAAVLLMAAGGEHMEDIEVLRQDRGLCRLMGREFPSPDALRDFLMAFHDEELVKQAQEEALGKGEKSYVPRENEALKALGRVTAEFVCAAAQPETSKSATLELDATIIESCKQEAKTTYEGPRGYQPVLVHWAEQDLIVNDQFRDGNVPAAKDNLPVIVASFERLPEWVKDYALRADSACYEEKILKWLSNEDRSGKTRGKRIGFTISADMTTQLREVCEKVLEPDAGHDEEMPRWQMLDDTRPYETVEWSEVEFTPGDWPKEAQPLRYIVLRFKRRQGDLYASGERVKYLAVVTNREEPGDWIVRWHWQKAGGIEHVHDDVKNGLGGGTLPCGAFGGNAAWLRLTTLAYNVLSVLRHRALPPDMKNAKPKRLRFLVFTMAATLTSHAGYTIARIAEWILKRSGLWDARALFRSLRQLARRHALPLPAG